MEIDKIILSLQSNDFVPQIRYYKYIVDNGTKTCDDCLRYAGEIYADNDPSMPELPIHPNCGCSFAEVNQEEFLKQQSFEFGNMTHDKWENQTDEEKYLWCNSFRNRFGSVIDKYARQNNIPKELLAGVIANEMLDWKFPDGTWLDGIGGGGVGYAQIAMRTAKKHGAIGSNSEIKDKLSSYEGSVEIAAKILKDYFDEFCKSVKRDRLGSGFKKSTLYYMPQPHILERENFVDMKVPEWLLNTMCAVWNSEIGVIYAQRSAGR